MTDTFHCDDKAQLVAYLYDELDERARSQVETHLRWCQACADEADSLRDVRQELAGWAPPDVDLGFTIVPAAEVPAPVLQPVRPWGRPAMPAWARLAAAALVVAAGLSILNLRISYGSDGLVVTTGWMQPAAPASDAAASVVAMPAAEAPAVEAPWRQELAALEQSLRGELADARREAVPTAAADIPARALSPERVSSLIEQSEQRQRQELALRLAQFGRDLEVQRRSDLVRINQGLGQFEGRAGAEILRQRQMLDYIMRVSAPPPPQ